MKIISRIFFIFLTLIFLIPFFNACSSNTDTSYETKFQNKLEELSEEVSEFEKMSKKDSEALKSEGYRLLDSLEEIKNDFEEEDNGDISTPTRNSIRNDIDRLTQEVYLKLRAIGLSSIDINNERESLK